MRKNIIRGLITEAVGLDGTSVPGLDDFDHGTDDDDDVQFDAMLDIVDALIESARLRAQKHERNASQLGDNIMYAASSDEYTRAATLNFIADQLEEQMTFDSIDDLVQFCHDKASKIMRRSTARATEHAAQIKAGMWLQTAKSAQKLWDQAQK